MSSCCGHWDLQLLSGIGDVIFLNFFFFLIFFFSFFFSFVCFYISLLWYNVVPVVNCITYFPNITSRPYKYNRNRILKYIVNRVEKSFGKRHLEWNINSEHFILLLTDLYTDLTWIYCVAKHHIVSKASSTSHSWPPYSGVSRCILWNSSQPTRQMYVYLFKWLPTGVNVGWEIQGGSQTDTAWNLAKGNWGWIQMRPGRKERNGTALSGSSLALNFYTLKGKCWSVLGASCRGFYTWVHDCEQVNINTLNKTCQCNPQENCSNTSFDDIKKSIMLQWSFRMSSNPMCEIYFLLTVRSMFHLGNTIIDTEAPS